jgi:hypothetical protein
MKKQTYTDVLCKAEAIAKDPKSLKKNGRFKMPVQRRLSRLSVRIAFLSQFEKPNQEYSY